MNEGNFNIYFSTDELLWETDGNIKCINTSFNTTQFEYLVGEDYHGGTYMYTVLYPHDAVVGDIAVIAHASQWQMLGKCHLKIEKWADWVSNLIRKDVESELKSRGASLQPFLEFEAGRLIEEIEGNKFI